MDVGEVLNVIRTTDALSALRKDWKAIFDYNLYGDPSLSLLGEDPALRSDVVFLLDGSGSMVSPEPGKWQAAVDAAVLFYDLMNALRAPTFTDHYSSVVFRWLVPGYIDGTSTVPAGSGMKDMSIPLTAAVFNPGFTPQPPYMTPMGDGLQLAADQFVTDTEESLYTDKMIILLSDGKHNTGTEPLAVTEAVDWPASVRVFAVGLGEDDIEPETIEQIAESTYGDYRISPSPREIEGFFCEIFCDISAKLQDVTVTGTTAPIDQDKVVFIVVWDDPGTSLTFDLDPPDGPNITPAAPGSYCTWHPAAAGATHAYYVCDGLPSAMMGDWQFVNLSAGGAPVAAGDVLLKVIEDPRTIAEFAIDDADYSTGQPIVLTARITEDGIPRLGLADVYAELIRSPAVAMGTLMAQNEPPPADARQTPGRADLTPRVEYLRAVMNKLGLSSLSALGGARIPLQDDGRGADARADDGIYSGAFPDTQFEGSYTFRFRARGRTLGGRVFDRTTTLSEYVDIVASPDQTQVELVDSVVDQEAKTIRATLRVTPLDGFGSFLGPFRTEAIRPWSNVGQFEPSGIDNRDGSYSFTLVYPLDTTPEISIAVGDVLVAHQTPVRDLEKGWPAWLILLILLILLMLILIALLRRRRRRPPV